MILLYNLSILFEEGCKFPSSLTLSQEKDSQNILERLVYEEKYKLIYYTGLESVAYQGLLNCSYLLNDDLQVIKSSLLFQFQGIAFISCIQEKYKLSASLNSVFNIFHDLKFPK